MITDLGDNLRRLMARLDLTIDEVVERAGLDLRTVQGILLGRNPRPHARTLHRLAAGLGVPADELFQTPSRLAHRRFDRLTNPRVEEALTAEPALFADWTDADFNELYSRFGTGGGLTMDGALEAARQMNRNRQVHEQVAVVLESGEAELLRELVEVLHRRVLVSGPARD
jgi:transcriptional regulator with XRE-family HTH domain